MAFFVASVEARAARQIAVNIFEGNIEELRSSSRERVAFAIQFGSPAAFNSLLNGAATVLAEGSLFLMICIGFFLVSPPATVVAIIYFGAIAFAIQYFMGSLLKSASNRTKKTTIEANGILGDLISVYREASVLGIRDAFIQKIYQARATAASNLARQTYLRGMPRYIIETALVLGLAGFLFVQAVSGGIFESAGTIGVFLTGGFRLTAAILPLQSAMLAIKSAIPTASVAQKILANARPMSPSLESDFSTAKRISQRKPASVQVRNVDFSYSESPQPSIKNASLRIEPGSQVALIGASGSGKSTLVDLIAGVLVPESGEIEVLVDGNSTVSVSYVPQKPGLIRGSISENVALGCSAEEIDESKVEDCLSRANLLEAVNSLPDGIHSSIGNYQDGLSGGQIQRLGLARALYTEPNLLILDEATSALDSESEAIISEALNEMKGKVTVIFIAHRLNTVQHADHVFLIDEGSIRDSGTFQDLKRRNPSVERLVQLTHID
jgi:ATP-binding cassette subfamily C protein